MQLPISSNTVGFVISTCCGGPLLKSVQVANHVHRRFLRTDFTVAFGTMLALSRTIHLYVSRVTEQKNVQAILCPGFWHFPLLSRVARSCSSHCYLRMHLPKCNEHALALLPSCCPTLVFAREQKAAQNSRHTTLTHNREIFVGRMPFAGENSLE